MKFRLKRWLSSSVVLFLHVVPLLAFTGGVTAGDWIAFAILYLWAAFSVGVGLHRYFSHRAFKTGRGFQLFMAVSACTMFTDPIGFSGKHRLHHRHSDTERDVHSPRAGPWCCWLGSLFDEGYSDQELTRMTRDWNRYPELQWLHRYFFLPGLALGLVTYLLGGLSMLAIGFCLSRVVVLNSACAINYFCHRFGRRRFSTRDDSTNNAIVAWLTLGEGWHNNHHYFPAAARAGFRWWEIDLLYAMIKVLSWLGLVWDLRQVPAALKRDPCRSGEKEQCLSAAGELDAAEGPR